MYPTKEFKNKLLRSLFINFCIQRQHTIDLFESAQEQSILDAVPGKKNGGFKDVLYQFQCIVAATNAKIRVFTKHENVEYGIYVDFQNGKVTPKEELFIEDVAKILPMQITQVEEMLCNYEIPEDTAVLAPLWTMINHENLHHGELLLMFRMVDAELPKDFKDTWAL